MEGEFHEEEFPNNGNYEEFHDGNDPLESQLNHERRKRRSKNDPQGRQHKCEFCGKTYLSRPALSQHMKTKHMDRLGEFKRGRGRPRKNEIEGNGSNPKNKLEDFFSLEARAKSSFEEGGIDVPALLEESLRELYERYSDALNPDNKQNFIEEHPLLLSENPINKEPSEITYDESIIKYLNEISQKTNSKYFKFASKFTILFRESYNLIKKREFPNEIRDYSNFNTAEEVPDKCNDFISEFMEENEYFQLDTNEVIEIIQHFCSWLYENGLTTSVLSLM